MATSQLQIGSDTMYASVVNLWGSTLYVEMVCVLIGIASYCLARRFRSARELDGVDQTLDRLNAGRRHDDGYGDDDD